MMRIYLAVEQILEEIACPDVPPCNWEHWRDTGAQSPILCIGECIVIPLPLFMLGLAKRSHQRRWDAWKARA